MLSAEYLTRYRTDYNPYSSDEYYLSNPRPQPSVQPQHTTPQPSYSQNTHFSDPPTYTQNTFFPEQPTYNQNTLFPDPSSYTPQQQTSIPQSQPHTQTYNTLDFATPSQQTRNFLDDRTGFESPGTQQFHQHYAHYNNQTIQPPDPTQPFNQNLTQWQLSDDFLNLSWANYAATQGHGGGESSTAVHGGEGLTAGEGSPMAQAYNFFDLSRDGGDDDGQQYGRGHRQGYPPPCGTGGHLNNQHN
jgi:hypothetical protein